ncbi:MAG: efflux RND transporter periplasmic adaptor subunit [Methylococcaceae bacterium]|jgi:multidrug efflux system membrane fusion protein
MSHSSSGLSRKTLIRAGMTSVALTVFLIWLEGGFEARVTPGTQPAATPPAVTGLATATVERRDAETVVSWPATVAALTVTPVAPKIAGRITDISVRPGSVVQRGQILAHLESSALQARVGQSRAVLAAAEAEAGRARADAHRLRNLYEREAATRQAFDVAMAATQAADAHVAGARDALREAESGLGENQLRAPFDGVIVSRDQEPGVMALPGMAIVTLQQNRVLRLEAAIPAACADGITLGKRLTAKVGHPVRDITVTVDEIQPAANPRSHTVLIKARLPEQTAIAPGSFGWLEQSCGQTTLLLAPEEAISRVGQLETVSVMRDGRPHLRHVRTGKRIDGRVEILSGLAEGDIVQLTDKHP